MARVNKLAKNNINFTGLDSNGNIIIANPSPSHPATFSLDELPPTETTTTTVNDGGAKDYNYVTERNISQVDDYTTQITITMEDSFRNFEPLRCGANAIPEGTYNIKDNGEYKTPEYQAYVNNGFSVGISTNDYKIYGHAIQGLEKGTVPMAACPGITTFIYGCSDVADIYVDVDANGKKTLRIVKDILNPNSALNTSFSEEYFNTNAVGNRVFPKKVGIVLVGGGGGAGG